MSEGRWEGKLASRGGGEESRAIGTLLYSLLRNSLNDKLVTDILIIHQGIIVLIRIR